jgi:hypothetical protein
MNILKVAEYLDCPQGRSLDEGAGFFGVSKRSLQRWIERISTDYPGLDIKICWDDAGTKRFRCIGRSKIETGVIGKRDIMMVWSVTLASHLMRQRGLHDDADALVNLQEALLEKTPRATRIFISQQIERLSQSEGLSNQPAPNRGGNKIAIQLRLAMLDNRRVRLELKDGRYVEGYVKGVIHDLEVCVTLVCEGREIIVALQNLASTWGLDDLSSDYFLATG